MLKKDDLISTREAVDILRKGTKLKLSTQTLLRWKRNELLHVEGYGPPIGGTGKRAFRFSKKEIVQFREHPVFKEYLRRRGENHHGRPSNRDKGATRRPPTVAETGECKYLVETMAHHIRLTKIQLSDWLKLCVDVHQKTTKGMESQN